MATHMKRMFQEIGRLASLAESEKVISSLAAILRSTMHAQATAAYYFDRERKEFSSCTCRVPGRYSDSFSSSPFSGEEFDFLSRSFRRRRWLPLEGSGVASRLTPHYRELLRRFSLLVFPMTVRGELAGIVVTGRSRRRGELTPGEREMAAGIVSHAALVISHIRLFDESLEMAVDMGQRIDVILALDEINKAISSSLSRKTVLERGVDHVERMLQCSLVAVLEERRGELFVADSYSRDPGLARILYPAVQPLEEGSVVADAFSSAVTCSRILDASPQSVLERRLYEGGLRSLQAIPLIGRERSTGVLLLANRRSDAFLMEETFAAEKIAAQLAVALENARLYEDLKKLFISTTASLANAISAKSPWTKGHSERVMHTAGRIARAMGLPEERVERVRIAGLLHDIGKIGIFESVLEKTTSLDADESPVMHLHPQKGVAILEPIEQLKEVLPGILHHHERWDGSGYPDGLKGEEIPLEARIVGVADAFDAMVAARPYRKGRSVREALQELAACAGTQFDPGVVATLRRYVEERMEAAPGGA